MSNVHHRHDYRNERDFALAAVEHHDGIRQAIGPGMHYPACQSGPCAQGARLCITPEACRLADEAVPRQVVWLALGVLAFLAAVGFGIALLTRGF